MRRPPVTLLLPALLGLAAAVPAASPDDGLAPSPEEIRPLLVGSRVPEVTVRTVTGEPFPLRAAVAKKPTVLVFYRGGW